MHNNHRNLTLLAQVADRVRRTAGWDHLPPTRLQGVNQECSKDGKEQDEGFFTVDSIIGHRFTANYGIEYLTRWQGYGPEDDTWEPTASFHRCMVLIENYNLAHFGVTRLSRTRSALPMH